ncbi:hypothetical protein CLH62_17150 [Marinobacter guineae]|uniref:Crp/Fnr family transcriptional regulator n=1 Tax=Marinobacter guineae TaxID=432303 RepID=A0A2G1VCZ3_9GAMM|nr:PAS domain S-box protein [Marinobacter guineae]PHQ24616.1 hypothetical protein CLH62_17150 [Marinobacter guineae]
MKRAEQDLQRIIDAAPTGMIVINKVGSITLANTQAALLFGYSPEELIGMPVDALVPSLVRSQHSHLGADFLEGPGAQRMGPEREIEGLRKDGTQFSLDVGLSSYGEGDDFRVIAAFSDTTELKHAQKEVERAAFEDRLTGLLSPEGFAQRLEEHPRNKTLHPASPIVVVDIKALEHQTRETVDMTTKLRHATRSPSPVGVNCSPAKTCLRNKGCASAQTLITHAHRVIRKFCRSTLRKLEWPERRRETVMMTEGCERERNSIIETLPGKEGHRFAAKCHRTALNQGDVLCESNQDLQKAYFPTSGVISLAMTLDDRSPLELGLIGRDGMLGATLSLGILAAPMRAIVQVAGASLVMATAQLEQELRANARLLELVHHYQFRLMMQTLQTAACIHFHEIEPRLARWLLMTQELGLTDTVHLTHSQLAHALGVRRSGITLAVCSLHRRGLISHSRGEIRILDHAGLESAACDCHATLINRYRMVFGKDTGGQTTSRK